MNSNSMMVEQLRKEVMSGNITPEDVRRRLTVAIEEEYLKDSPDIDFINLCEDMLWKMGTPDEMSFASANQQYLDAIEKCSGSTPKSTARFRRYGAIAAIFVIVLIPLLGSILHFQWFTTHSTVDEQQYVIRGHSIDAQAITKAIAEHEDQPMLQTRDYADVIAALGYAPSIPDPAAILANDVIYVIIYESEKIVLTILYSGINNTENAIIYTVQYFTSLDDRYVLFEQTQTGQREIIHNKEAYVTENEGRISIIWQSDSAVHNLAGNISQKVAYEITEQLIGGQE